jgi:hypothetical protein
MSGEPHKSGTLDEQWCEGAGNASSIADRGPTANSASERTHAPIRAKLIGDTCTAAGLTARGHSPLLGLCCQLVAADFDPLRPLHCYRGAMLTQIVRQIGEAARLRIASHAVGFERLPECTGGPPVHHHVQDRETSSVGVHSRLWRAARQLQ